MNYLKVGLIVLLLNEFYEAVSRKIPHSQRISTTGKAKDYVSTLIAQILNVPEIEFQEI